MAVSSFKGSISGATTTQSSSKFYLNVGSSGNTTYVFEEIQQAGAYSITSELQDSSYDIYAIADDSSLAGFTNQDTLVALKDFSKIVVYGATLNDLIVFTFESVAVSTETSGDVNGGAAGYLTSISPSALPNIDDSATITGGNLATDVEIYFIAQDNSETPAKSVVRNNSSELVVTRPDTLDPDKSPYSIKAINPGVPLPSTQPNAHILTNALTVGTYPSVLTPSPLFWEKGETTQIQINVSDEENSNITYQIIDGALLSGLTLDSSTGIITGLDSSLNPEDFSTFTVRATDEGGLIIEKRFEIYVNRIPIYSWYFDAFVTAGKLEKILLPTLVLQ